VIQYSWETKTDFYAFNVPFKAIDQIYTKQEA
jgi:hypothetical protein